MAGSAPLYLTTEELHERTGIPVETLRTWRKLKRELPFERFGRRIKYRIADVEAWEQSGRVPVGT